MYGVIQILLADGFGLGQGSVFFYVQFALVLVRLRRSELRFSLNELRLCLRQLALGLIERRLERTGIDLKEQLAFLT